VDEAAVAVDLRAGADRYVSARGPMSAAEYEDHVRVKLGTSPASHANTDDGASRAREYR
jgi:hypothetical protein